ncbi:hypothetical protein ACOMHN_021681 [Nucella lapillus]
MSGKSGGQNMDTQGTCHDGTAQMHAFTQKIREAADEREETQKKTFGKWINSQLSKTGRGGGGGGRGGGGGGGGRGGGGMVGDLTRDLGDGTLLLSLLEELSPGLVLPREKGRLRVHHINNVNTVLRELETTCHMKLVNISSSDIVDGNAKLILGLVWSIIMHWQATGVMRLTGGDVKPINLERTLLTWCQTHTAGYDGVLVVNFTTSWRDGLAFNALIHHFRPDLFHYDSLQCLSGERRLNHAFDLAHRALGIVPLLEAEDVMLDFPDKKSIMTYLMCFYQVLPDSSLPPSSTPPHRTRTPNPTMSPSSSSSSSPAQPQPYPSLPLSRALSSSSSSSSVKKREGQDTSSEVVEAGYPTPPL